MAHLTPAQLDRLERAVQDGRRIAIVRHGSELVVTATRLSVIDGRETLEARHPVTGQPLSVRIEDLDRWEIIAR